MTTAVAERPVPLPRWRVWIPRLVVLAALAAVLVVEAQAALLFARHAEMALAFPYPLNYGEGPLLDQAVRLAAGENIYRPDLNAPPFTIANYPPLYMLIQTPFVNAFGGSYFYGRLVSVVSVALAALFLGLTLRAITRDGVAALAGGLALLAMPYIVYWSPLYRIDSLALALSWAGLFIVAQWPERRWSIVVAALLCAAAIFTRQTYALAAPLAAFVWLLAQPRRLRAWLFALLLANFVLWGFGLMQALSDGGFFVHVVTANVNAFDRLLIDRAVTEVVTFMPFLLGAAVLYLVLGVARRERAAALVVPYTLGALAAAFTIGKVGSDVNYLYELSAGLCLSVGALVGLRRAWWAWRVVLLVALAAQLVVLIGLSEERYLPKLALRAIPDRAAHQDALRAVFVDADGVVLADEAMGLLPLTGRQVYFQPFEMKQLADAGLWDDTALAAEIEAGAFALVSIYQPMDYPGLYTERWTEALRGALNERYIPLKRIGETTVYRPR